MVTKLPRKSLLDTRLEIFEKGISLLYEGFPFGCQLGSPVPSTQLCIHNFKSCSLLHLFNRTPGMPVGHPQFVSGLLNGTQAIHREKQGYFAPSCYDLTLVLNPELCFDLRKASWGKLDS